jgi:predicted DNA binding CopG/RHH family protein
MSKKNFKNNNPALAFISNPEQREDKAEDNTQEEQLEKAPQKKHPTGRKGQKLPRINMAFSHENLEYLQIMARIEGVSMTQYVNTLIEADRKKRADVIEKAKGILKGVD